MIRGNPGEAAFSKALMERYGLRSAMVVLSDYHMRRASLISTHFLKGSDTVFTYVSVKGLDFHFERWCHLARIEQIHVGMVKAGQDREEAAAAQIKELSGELVAANAAVADERQKVDHAVAAAGGQVREADAQIKAARAETARIREAVQKEV